MNIEQDKSCPLILTADQMRAADRYCIEEMNITGISLMEKAGAAVAKAVLKCVKDMGRIVIIVGSGNNGGDGLVAARILKEKRVSVTVILLVPLESLKGDAALALASAEQANVKIRLAVSSNDLELLDSWLKRAMLVVDCIFGTGLKRPLKGWFADVVDQLSLIDRQILSVDIASGIDSDDGHVLGHAVQATWTLPIAACKWGHWLAEGRIHAGEILSVADIGIPNSVLESMQKKYPSIVKQPRLMQISDMRCDIFTPTYDAHKKEFGHMWIFGGSVGFTGAPRLAADAAMATRAGLVSIACPKDVWAVMASSNLEVMVHPQDHGHWKQADAILVGPGWGKDQSTMLTEILLSDVPLVLDADALNMVADDVCLADLLRRRTALSVLTPHPGEAARLLATLSDEIQHDRLASVQALVEKFQCNVVLKGAKTLAAFTDQEVRICPFGSVNLARAGTGDVLAGMLVSLLAQSSMQHEEIDVKRMVSMAVVWHARAGESDDWYRSGQLPTIVSKLSP